MIEICRESECFLKADPRTPNWVVVSAILKNILDFSKNRENRHYRRGMARLRAPKTDLQARLRIPKTGLGFGIS